MSNDTQHKCPDHLNGEGTCSVCENDNPTQQKVGKHFTDQLLGEIHIIKKVLKEQTKTIKDYQEAEQSLIKSVEHVAKERDDLKASNASASAIMEGVLKQNEELKEMNAELEKESHECTCTDPKEDPYGILCKYCYIQNALTVCKQHDDLKAQLIYKDNLIDEHRELIKVKSGEIVKLQGEVQRLREPSSEYLRGKGDADRELEEAVRVCVDLIGFYAECGGCHCWCSGAEGDAHIDAKDILANPIVKKCMRGNDE